MLNRAHPHAVFGNDGGGEAGVVDQFGHELNRAALFAGQISAAEYDAAVFGSRMQGKQNPLAGMQADAGGLNGLG